MRLIYHTTPVEVSFPTAQGTTVTGFAAFRVCLAESDADIPVLPNGKPARFMFRRLADIRTSVGQGRPIVAKQHASSKLRGILPDEVTIPESVLQSLPADARLRFSWAFGSLGAITGVDQ